MQEISQPAVSRREGDHIRWGWVALTVVGLEITLIISAVAWVTVYSYLINPGHDLPYYQNHAQKINIVAIGPRSELPTYMQVIQSIAFQK